MSRFDAKSSDQFKDIDNFARDVDDSDEKLTFDQIRQLGRKWETTGERIAGERVSKAKEDTRKLVLQEAEDRAKTLEGVGSVDDLYKQFGTRGSQISDWTGRATDYGARDVEEALTGYKTRGEAVDEYRDVTVPGLQETHAGELASQQTAFDEKYGTLQGEYDAQTKLYGVGGEKDYAKSQWELQAQKDKVSGLETLYGEGGEKDYAALKAKYGEGGTHDYAALKQKEAVAQAGLKEYGVGGTKDYAQALQNLKDQQSAFNIKYGDLDTLYQDLDKEYGILDTQHKGLQGQYTDLEGDYGDIQEKYGKGGSHDYEALQGQYTGLQGTHGILETQHKGLQGQYEDIQDKYGKGGTHDYEALHGQYTGLQGEHGLLQGQHKGLQGSYGALESKYGAGGTHDYSALQKDYGTLQGEHGHLKGELKGWQSAAAYGQPKTQQDSRGIQVTDLSSTAAGQSSSQPKGGTTPTYDYDYDYSYGNGSSKPTSKPKSSNLMSDEDRMALITGGYN